MKSPLSVLIVFLFAVTSCSDHIKTTTSSKNPIYSTSDKSASDFQEYLNTLEQIPLPFTHNSFVPIEALSKNYHKKRFKQFKHHGSTVPLGILFKDRKTVTLIDISDDQLGVPFLTTYDKLGNKIDSLALYPKTSQDFRNNVIYVSKAYFTIYKNKSIRLIDTVTTHRLLPRNSIAGDMREKLRVSVKKYSIEPYGRIRNIN
ncbi:MAG: hypothetical protein RL110_671 [Bacteroidota bacterium]|jgi:hypothetical protein|nr:hypothetical protein [Flavobacteriia bacterium]